MANRRASKKQPFDVDAYIMKANEAIRDSGLTTEQLDAIHRGVQEDPETERALRESDELFEQLRANVTKNVAVPRGAGASRKKTA